MNDDIRSTRLMRLRELRDQRFQGNSKRLAVAIKRSESQLSQWFTGVRTITEGSARRIEKVLALPAGWLDVTERATTGAGGVTVGGQADTGFAGGVQIPQLDVTASMGPGALVPSYEDVITVLRVNEAALRAQLGPAPISSLRNLIKRRFVES